MDMDHGMTFQFTRNATLLFSGWSTYEGFGYNWMCILCFCAGVLAVVFKYLRNEMELRLFAFADANRYARTRVKYLTYALSNACRAAALFTILTWDYFLMLGAMTFNAGIFLSIVSGVACGFLFMGHLFITNSVAATSERVLASLHYPQRVDVACSPQVESSPSAPPRGLLSAVEISQCGCTV